MKVLWISRHEMTAAQRAELARLCGGEAEVSQWKDSVESIQQLIPAIGEADVIAAVLPLHLLAELFSAANGKPVLIAQSNRTLAGQHITQSGIVEPDAQFEFHQWQRLRELKVVLEPAGPLLSDLKG